MNPVSLIVLAVVGLVIFYLVVQYNRFITMRNKVRQAYSSLDVMLKKRYDLIPNLVAAVKGYAAHEQAIFEQVAQLRSKLQTEKDTPSERFTGEINLTEYVKKILLVSENYPQLKAVQSFVQLQMALADVEENISAARRAYNAAVNRLNSAIMVFPSNLVARAFRFAQQPLFKIEQEVEKTNNTVAF